MAERRYLVLWTTTLTEHHRSWVELDELPENLVTALRAGRQVEDGTVENDQLREYAATVEGYETQTDVIVQDRVVTITEEDA